MRTLAHNKRACRNAMFKNTAREKKQKRTGKCDDDDDDDAAKSN